MFDDLLLDPREKQIKEAVLLLKKSEDESLEFWMKIVVAVRLWLLSDDIRAEATKRLSNPQTQPAKRMDPRDVRSAFDWATEDGKKYEALAQQWLEVNWETAADQLPLKGDTEGLKALLNKWAESHPDREKLVEEARQHRTENERQRWVDTAKAQWKVFQFLTTGVEEQDGTAGKLATLLDNFKSVNFQYTMQALNSDVFLQNGGDGDCNTLTYAFSDICQKFLQIPCQIISSADVGFRSKFLTPKHRTIDGKTGNVEGELWVFENHFWVKCDGTDYDVLFGESGKVDTSAWIPLTDTKEDGVEIYSNESGTIKVKATGQGVVESRYRRVD